MANLFGTLNRFISRLDSGSPQPDQQHPSRSTEGHGFQVLRNSSSTLPLEPWFDFVIGINGHNIENPDPQLFATEIRNCAGSTISLGVYGAKGQQIREIYVTVPQGTTSLGLALQWCPLNLTDDVWHILDVMPNSPADVAGLLPYGDFVIGSPDGVLRGDSGLGNLVEQFVEHPLRLYVYNNEYDVTRMITITPSKSWGGEGALGCVLGYGALHRIPAPLAEPSQGPGETLFESGNAGGGQEYQYAEQSLSQTGQGATPQQQPDAAQFFIPADAPIAAGTPPPPTGGAGTGTSGPPPGRPKKARANHAAAPTVGLDDYFAEGEKQSRETDNAPTPKATGGLPPPPKGGPPKAASPAPPAEED